jgi:hypothetical protein
MFLMEDYCRDLTSHNYGSMKFRKKDGHGVKEVNSKLEPMSVSYSPYPLSSWMPVTHRRGRCSSSLS